MAEKNTELLRAFFENVYTHRNKSLIDFDDFPIIPGVKMTNLKPFGFNNSTAIGYYSEDDLPDGLRHIGETKRKFITYMFLFKANGGMPYFGSTGDFGERMPTHFKDGRKDEKQLYDLLRTEDKFLIKVLGVHDTLEEARKVEKFYIEKYRELIGENICNQSINNFKEGEIRRIIKPYLLNITNSTK